MKISFVIGSFGGGGAERVASILLNEWCKDYDVTVILTSAPQRHKYLLDSRIHVYYLSQKKIFAFRKINKLTRILSSIQPDVVISFLNAPNFYATIAANRLNIVNISSERNNPKFSPRNLFLRILRHIAFSRSSVVVFQTQGAKKFFNSTIQQKSRIIPNPLAIEDSLLSLTRIIQNKIIAVGRLEKQKDYHVMLEAFAIFFERHKEFALEIYGEGESRNSILEKAEKLGISSAVFLKSFTSDIHSRMIESKIFLMSSKFEGFPNALLEAVALGIPCVSTNCPPGSPSEIIVGGVNGFLVDVGNSSQMANSMEKIISRYDDFILSSKLESQKTREKYGLPNILSQWDALFSDIGLQTKSNKNLKNATRIVKEMMINDKHH